MPCVPAWADVLGGNPPPPARPLRQVDAAAGLGYFLSGQRDGQIDGHTTYLSLEASTSGIAPAQGDVRPPCTLVRRPRCCQRWVGSVLVCAALVYSLEASCPAWADTPHTLTPPQGLKAISIATALRSSYAIGTAQGRALRPRGSLWPEHCR